MGNEKKIEREKGEKGERPGHDGRKSVTGGIRELEGEKQQGGAAGCLNCYSN